MTSEPTLIDRLLEVLDWIDTGHARKLRISSGITQGEMARACDVSQAAVTRWELGERRPRGRNAIAYHQALSRIAGHATN